MKFGTKVNDDEENKVICNTGKKHGCYQTRLLSNTAAIWSLEFNQFQNLIDSSHYSRQ